MHDTLPPPLRLGARGPRAGTLLVTSAGPWEAHLKDPRIDTLARILIRHSTRLTAGEHILIEAYDVPAEILVALVREARAVGGHPVVLLKNNQVQRELYLHADEASMSLAGRLELEWMKNVQAFIGIRGWVNSAELADVPAERMALYQRHWWSTAHREQRINQTRWVVLRYPSAAMAQQAGMSTAAFEDFYFNVCADLDYQRMSKAMDPLVTLMQRTDRVELRGPGTDLSFSIRGIPAIKCDGRDNIPDGEVYTAPVKTSVNGVITFNTPTVFMGASFENMRLELTDGRVVHATSSDTDRMNHILDSDEGARYIGEFAFGLNPHITRPLKDILFDEKIAGSLHLTPGNAYPNADNGNRSGVHWDMVLRQDPGTGGGEIRFDGVLIRQDGRFVIKELEGLNPENLT